MSQQLPEPRTAAGRAGLTALLAEPARSLVAVDFDGTLAPIVTRPEDARLATGAREALAALAARVGAVAIVTGRAVVEAVELGQLDGIPRLQVVGHYGLQRWAGGEVDTPPPQPAVEEARRRLPALLADAPPGVHLEDKVHSVAVHTRPAADPAAALAALTPPVTAMAAELGLAMVPGRFVLELRPPGVDKGSALRRLAADFAARAVVYVGDDLGDLPAYDAVSALRAAGVPGLTVASLGEDAPPELAERADLSLDGPAGVVGFLTALAAAVGG